MEGLLIERSLVQRLYNGFNFENYLIQLAFKEGCIINSSSTRVIINIFSKCNFSGSFANRLPLQVLLGAIDHPPKPCLYIGETFSPLQFLTYIITVKSVWWNTSILVFFAFSGNVIINMAGDRVRTETLPMVAIYIITLKCGITKNSSLPLSPDITFAEQCYIVYFSTSETPA
jgi:hypothetical protein